MRSVAVIVVALVVVSPLACTIAPYRGIDAADAADASDTSDAVIVDCGPPSGCSCGLVACGAACIDVSSDVNNCGACGNACSAPSHASPRCVRAVCGFDCLPTYTPSGFACLWTAPRPLAPLSTARTTSQRPTVRWQWPPGGATAGVVEWCRDRACNAMIERRDVTGASAQPANPLPAGPVFWRVRASGNAGVSPTWEFFVPRRDAGRDRSWGSIPDFNGDGVGDVVATASASNGNVGRAYEYLDNRRSGASTMPTRIIESPAAPQPYAFGSSATSAGDMNGDGFGDLLVTQLLGSGGQVHLYLGGPNGLATIPAASVGPPPPMFGFGDGIEDVGDVDGDGYADVSVVVGVGSNVEVLFGGESGWSGRRADITVTSGPNQNPTTGRGGDVNGDGFADVIAGWWGGHTAGIGSAAVYRGDATGVSTIPFATFSDPSGQPTGFGRLDARGDFNGDGYADVVVGAGLDYRPTPGHVYVYPGGPQDLATAPAVTITGRGGSYESFALSVVSVGDVDGDGFDDLAVSAPATNPSSRQIGHVYLFRGNASTIIETTAAATLTGSVGGGFGTFVAPLGDIDIDGYDDFAVSEPLRNGGSGRVFVFFGATGFAIDPAAALVRDAPDAIDAEQFGSAIARRSVRPGGRRAMACHP